jgi:hypothetical protein
MAALKQRATPILAAVAILLLLVLLYVGSYLAIVKPNGRVVQSMYRESDGELVLGNWYYQYRFGQDWAAQFYWPLEQIDRRVRPGVWDG